MDETTFATEVNETYRAVYLLGARRVEDARALPSAETMALPCTSRKRGRSPFPRCRNTCNARCRHSA